MSSVCLFLRCAAMLLVLVLLPLSAQATPQPFPAGAPGGKEFPEGVPGGKEFPEGAPGGKEFVLAPESRITVRTFKADPHSRLTHEHVVEGVDFSGSATYDPTKPETLSLEVTVDATTLRIDADEARQRLGLPLDISAANRLAIQETLLGPETLHVKRYPQIKFKSKSYTQKDGIWWLTGDLTLHGVTQRVDIPATVTLNGERLTGSAVFTIQTSAYRITPYSAFLGAIAVKDEVEMRLALVGVSVPAPVQATNAAAKAH